MAICDHLQSILVPDSDDDDIVDAIDVDSGSDVEFDASVEIADVVIGDKLESPENLFSTDLPSNSADTQFQCLVCDIQFTRETRSLRHILKHIGQPSVVLVRLSAKDDIEYKNYLERNSICEPPKAKRLRTVASGTKSKSQCLPSTDDVINDVSSKTDVRTKAYACSVCKIRFLHQFLLEEHQQITGHGSYIAPKPPMVVIRVEPPEDKQNPMVSVMNTIAKPKRPKDTIVASGTAPQRLPATENIQINEVSSMEEDKISKTYSCIDCKRSYLHQYLLEEHLRITGHGSDIPRKPPMVLIRVTPPEIKQNLQFSDLNTIPNTNQFTYPMQNRQATAIPQQRIRLFGRVPNIQPTTAKATPTNVQPTTAAAPIKIQPTYPAAPKNIQPITTSAPITTLPSMLTIRTIRPNYSANSQTQQPSQTTVSTVTMSLPPSLIIRKTTTPQPVQPIRSALFGHQKINAQPVAELSLIGRPGIRCVLSTNPAPGSPKPTNTVDAQFRLFGGLCTPNMTSQVRQPMLHRPPGGIIIRQHFRPPAPQRILNQVRPVIVNRTMHPMQLQSSNPLTVRVRLPARQMPVPPLVLRNSGKPIPPTQMLVDPGMIVNQPRSIGMPFIESVTGGAIVKVIRPPVPTPPTRSNVPAPVRLPVVNTAKLPANIRLVAPASRRNLAAVGTSTSGANSNTLVAARSIFDMMHEHDNEDAEMILS